VGGISDRPRRAGATRAAARSIAQRDHHAAAHSSGFKHLKSFYHGFAEPLLRGYFPGMPCYEHFVALQKSVFVPLVFFLLSHLGTRTGIYYIDSTALAIIIASTGIRRSGPARQDGLVLWLQAAPRLQQRQ
jgi:hypothetical protein